MLLRSNLERPEIFKQLLAVAGLALSATVGASSTIDLTSWKQNGVAGWESKSFVDETSYQVTSHKNRTALKAVSDRAASGLFLERRIDLLKTPYINWSWLIEKRLPNLPERSKDGDDYAARIYVVIDGGLIFWNAKSLSYVWSSSPGKGQVWDNAYAGSNVQIVSVRGKGDNVGRWYDEKRNVYKDLIKYFGDQSSERANQKSYRYIDVVAIMTDTDNSGSTAESYYGDIFFSTE